MPRFSGSPSDVSPVVDVVQESTAPAIRVRHEGASGNALEVVGAGGATLWSVDNKGRQSGGSASSVFDVVQGYGAVGDGVADDTTPIQNALNAAHAVGGGKVTVPRGTYLISASLTIYSNTTLELDPSATIALKSGSNSNMIHNAAWVAGSGRDSNITIKGGTWKVLTNNDPAAGQSRFLLLLQRVDGFYVGFNTWVRVDSTDVGRNIVPYACTNGVIEETTHSTGGVGVLITGASRGIRVSGVYGSTGDDSTIVTPIDFTPYQNGDFGDCVDIIIERVFTTVTNHGSGAKAYVGSQSGTPYSCRGITISDIAVDVTQSGSVGFPVWVGGDQANVGAQNGYLYDVFVDNVRNTNTGTGSCTVRVGDAGATGIIKNLRLSRIAPANYATYNAIRFESSNSALIIDECIIENCAWQDAPNGAESVYLNSGASNNALTISDLTFRNCYFAPPAATYVIKFNTSTNMSVSRLRLEHCRLNATAGLVNTSAATTTLSNVFAKDLIVDAAVHILGDYWATCDFYLDGIVVTGSVTDLMNARATVNIRELNGLKGSNVDTIAGAGTVHMNDVALATPVYSASITPATQRGYWQTITVTNATAFTINAPTGPPDSSHTRELTIEILNSSGGAMGAITWNAVFKFGGFVWANPATGNRRWARFEWNGSAWICTGIATADYA